MSDSTNHVAQWIDWYQSRGWHITTLYAPASHAADPGDAACSCHRGPECAAPGKHPVAKNWQVPKMWGRGSAVGWEGRNLGVLTGGASGILTVDLDGPEGETTARAVVDAGWLELPQTLELRTGRGRQLVYALPDSGPYCGARVVSVAGKFDALGHRGFDVRGEGGQFVAPPSIHYTGRPYEWADPAAVAAPAPDSLMAYAVNGRVTPTGDFEKQAGADPAALVGEAMRRGHLKGTRNRGLFDLIAPVAACYGNSDLAGPAVVESVYEFAHWLNRHRMSPPLEEPEVDRVVQSALERNKVGIESAREWLIEQGAPADRIA